MKLVSKKKKQSAKVKNFAEAKMRKEEAEKLKQGLDSHRIDMDVSGYYSLAQSIKTATEQKNVLAKRIKEYAKIHGTQDDKGSYYCENDEYIFGQTAVISIKPRKNIFDKLKEMGFEDCIKMVPEVDEKLLNKYHDEGALSDENIEELYERVEMTPRILVKLKEEMPEVEQKKVASRKGKK